MQVPFFRPSLAASDADAIVEALKSGWLTRGPRCREFEQRFARHVGADDAVSVSSGTAALTIAMASHGVGPGCTVVVPSLTFTATAEAVLSLGAVPVLVDCCTDTLCIDPAKARVAIEGLVGEGRPAPAAIIPVHYGGLLADCSQIELLASQYGSAVVHDAAHCLSSYYREDPADPWKPIGTLGGSLCFSLYANKCITTAEGGMIASSGAIELQRARHLSVHGIRSAESAGRTGLHWDYEVAEPGFKSNLPDLLAALGVSQLDRAAWFQQRREAIAKRYTERLSGRIPAGLPAEPADRRGSWHLYPLRLNLDELRIGRNEIIKAMFDCGVVCSVHWRPLHLHSGYRTLIEQSRVRLADCSATDAVWPRLMSLPIFPDLTIEEQDYVCDIVEQTLNGARR